MARRRACRSAMSRNLTPHQTTRTAGVIGAAQQRTAGVPVMAAPIPAMAVPTPAMAVPTPAMGAPTPAGAAATLVVVTLAAATPGAARGGAEADIQAVAAIPGMAVRTVRT